MSLDQFNGRLKAEREAARREWLKDLGADKIEDVKARLAKASELENAQLSELEKAKKTAQELAGEAKRAQAYEASIKKYLEAEEAAIPEGKRSLLDLAPEQPEARLEWLAKAKTKGLFAEPPPPAPKTETQAPAPREAKPATTMAPAGPSNPKPAGTPSLLQQYLDLKKTNTLAAAHFRLRHEKAIEEEQRAKSA